MKRIFFLVAFFLATPSLLVVSLTLLLYLSYQQTGILGRNNQQNKAIAYAALPSNLNTLNDTVNTQDVRIGKVSLFLETYNSPLSQYASFIVETADKYNIDYRLLPAIAMQESGLCKKMIPGASDNCWGYGIYGKTKTSFGSYEEAIDTITRYFSNKKKSGIDTLDEIGSIYNPTDHNNWKANVASFMTQL